MKNGPTVAEILERGATPFSAQKVVSEGGKPSYFELFEKARKIASFLNSIGAKRGDIVCIADWNSIRFVEIFYACAMHGSINIL